MKNKGEIKEDIFGLAQKISRDSSEKFLLETIRDLYEKAILMKHAPDADMPLVEKEAEKAGMMADTTIKTESQPVKQAMIDLFSAEETVAPSKAADLGTEILAPAEESVQKKPATKDRKGSNKKAEETMAEKLQHKRIADLKAAIGINEKFRFINELFEGNMKEYNCAVDQINSFASLSEAESYIATLEDMYRWSPDNRIAENFRQLVQRRFA